MARSNLLRLTLLASAAALSGLTVGCATGEPHDLDPSISSLYALVEGVEGFSFYPPLGPERAPQGPFDATLLDGLSIALEAEDAGGAVREVGRFDSGTRPALALLGPRELYHVGVPASEYVTDPAETYRFVVFLDGEELGRSVLTSRVFDVAARYPALEIGVHVRIEGQAVRSAARVRTRGGAPHHCSDGQRNKDESGVDCGGSQCRPCETCTDGVQNQGEGGVDCGGPCPNACETCADGIRNQGEGGVDCGGPCPNACLTGCPFAPSGAVICSYCTCTRRPCWGIDNGSGPGYCPGGDHPVGACRCANAGLVCGSCTSPGY